MPPKYIADGIWLNKWLNEQKQIYNGNRKGKQLTQSQIELLNAIGMCWVDKRDKAWEARYSECRKFCKRFGHLNIPSSYKPASPV